MCPKYNNELENADWIRNFQLNFRTALLEPWVVISLLFSLVSTGSIFLNLFT